MKIKAVYNYTLLNSRGYLLINSEIKLFINTLFEHDLYVYRVIFYEVNNEIVCERVKKYTK